MNIHQYYVIPVNCFFFAGNHYVVRQSNDIDPTFDGRTPNQDEGHVIFTDWLTSDPFPLLPRRLYKGARLLICRTILVFGVCSASCRKSEMPATPCSQG